MFCCRSEALYMHMYHLCTQVCYDPHSFDKVTRCVASLLGVKSIQQQQQLQQFITLTCIYTITNKIIENNT